MRKVFAATAILTVATGLAAARAADQREIRVDSTVSGEVSKRAADSIERIRMRVSLLRAGASVAEVDQVMGQPTFTTAFDEASGDNRVLVYA